MVDVARLSKTRRGSRDLLLHICAPEERAQDADDARGAQLWAGKEAVAKALGTGLWQDGVDWTDIRIDPENRVTLHGRCRQIGGEDEIRLTFSRLGLAAVAVALRWGLR